MPALIVTGRPRVGKTSFVNLVAKRALDNAEKYNITQVVIINEETACQSTKSSNIQSDTIDPDSNGKILNYRQYYLNSHVEKSTRAALKAEFDRRQSGSGTLVLLDSLNYIKGYRYELYCISKASGDKHGVVWVKSDELDTDSYGWHRSCPSIDSTASATTRTATTKTEEDLIINGLNLRFESPDERNRWENPLYIVNMGGSTKNGELQQTVDEILDSFLLKVKALKTGLSTQKPLPAASNVSYDLFCWYSDPDQGGLTINLLLLSYI
jgi:protein KTI12